MDIHYRIKLARMMGGMRQTDLADVLGIKQSVVTRYEVPNGRVPRADFIYKIAEATGWPVNWFDEGKLEGLIVSTFTMAAINYSETALATIERGLTSLLPDLF